MITQIFSASYCCEEYGSVPAKALYYLQSRLSGLPQRPLVDYYSSLHKQHRIGGNNHLIITLRSAYSKNKNNSAKITHYGGYIAMRRRSYTAACIIDVSSWTNEVEPCLKFAIVQYTTPGLSHTYLRSSTFNQHWFQQKSSSICYRQGCHHSADTN